MFHSILYNLVTEKNKQKISHQKTHCHLDTGKPHHNVTVWDVWSSPVRPACPFWAPPVLVPCPTLHEECWIPSAKWGGGMLCPQGPLHYTQEEGAAVSGAGSLRPRWSSFLPHKGENTSQAQVPPEKNDRAGIWVKYSHLSDRRLCPLSPFYLLRNPKLLGEEKSFILGEQMCLPLVDRIMAPKVSTS